MISRKTKKILIVRPEGYGRKLSNLQTLKQSGKFLRSFKVYKCAIFKTNSGIFCFTRAWMFTMERGRNRVTHCGSDSVVTLRYFSWRTNFILIRASKTEQLCSKAKRLWCVLQKNYRFNKSNTNYMMPLAPMAQELARRIRQTTSFLHMNYIHLHLHSFVSWYKFTYLDPAWSEPTGTDMIDRHRAIILASGSLRNVFTYMSKY